MRRFPYTLILASIACSRARVSSSPAPGLSTVIAMERITGGSVTGYVMMTTGRALSEAALSLDNRVGTHSDSAGRFRFEGVSPGTHTMRVLHVGFDRAIQAFTLDAGSGAAFVVRLAATPMQLMEVCTTEADPSIDLHVPDVPGTTIEVAHGGSVERFRLDSMYDDPRWKGMRTAAAFYEQPGRFEVTAEAPGYRTWHTTVSVLRGRCHVITRVVTVELIPEL